MTRLSIPSIELLDDFLDTLPSKGLVLPDFSNSKHVVIISDYAGERSDDTHYSYSFYLVDYFDMIRIASNIAMLRQSEPKWKEHSYIEYKNVSRIGTKEKILPHFLNLFDQFPGIVFTVLVAKNSPSFFLRVTDKETSAMEEMGYGAWKPHILKKSANIMSLLSLLTKKFLHSDCKLTWFSDRDDIFGAGQQKQHYALKMLSGFFIVFGVAIKEKRYGFVSDNGSSLQSDILSVPDLSAGGVLEYYQNAQVLKADVKPSTKTIIGWLSTNTTKLKKLIAVGSEVGGAKKLEVIRNY